MTVTKTIMTTTMMRCNMQTQQLIKRGRRGTQQSTTTKQQPRKSGNDRSNNGKKIIK